MVTKYVLSFWDAGRKRYIRVYKNARYYVVRKHAGTATWFCTEEDAKTMKEKFVLSNCSVELMAFTNEV